MCILLAVLGSMPLMPLPEGWIGVNHKSGGIVYLHKKTRVVTWSRPYFIGTASLRVSFGYESFFLVLT